MAKKIQATETDISVEATNIDTNVEQVDKVTSPDEIVEVPAEPTQATPDPIDNIYDDPNNTVTVGDVQSVVTAFQNLNGQHIMASAPTPPTPAPEPEHHNPDDPEPSTPAPAQEPPKTEQPVEIKITPVPDTEQSVDIKQSVDQEIKTQLQDVA
jgi:hypothetical protein